MARGGMGSLRGCCDMEYQPARSRVRVPAMPVAAFSLCPNLHARALPARPNPFFPLATMQDAHSTIAALQEELSVAKSASALSAQNSALAAAGAAAAADAAAAAAGGGVSREVSAKLALYEEKIQQLAALVEEAEARPQSDREAELEARLRVGVGVGDLGVLLLLLGFVLVFGGRAGGVAAGGSGGGWE